MANVDVLTIYRDAIAANPSTFLKETDVEELIAKIKKYKMNGWTSCSPLSSVNNTMDISILESRYSTALSCVSNFEAKKDYALNRVYAYLQPNIKRMIEERYIPHIEDVIIASQADNLNSYEMSSALKGLAIELCVKNIHVLTNDQIAKDALENKILDLIRNATMSGSESDKLNAIDNLNANDEFFNNIFSYTSGQTAEQMDNNIWKVMTSVLYEVKSLDELKQELTNNPKIANRQKPLGHEINELLEALKGTIFRDLIHYKGMTNIPSANELSKRIKDLSDEDYFSGIDMLLMLIKFDSKKQVDSQKQLLAENTEAFIDYRYIEDLSNEEINNLLSSFSVASYMILDFVLNNQEISKKGLDLSDYESLKNVFSREEFDKLNDIVLRQGLDYKTVIFYYAFMKNYVDVKHIDLNDSKMKNINELFKTIRDSNSIVDLGNMFNEWYSNVDPYELSREELDEIQRVFPKFFFDSLNYNDKYMFNQCREYGIPFEFYYKSNKAGFDKVVELCGVEGLRLKTISIDLLMKSPEEISEYYDFCNSIGINMLELPSHLLNKSADSLYRYNEYFKSKGMSLDSVPVHYFKYDLDVIQCTMSKLEEDRLLTDDELFDGKCETVAIKSIAKMMRERGYELSDIEKLSPEYIGSSSFSIPYARAFSDFKSDAIEKELKDRSLLKQIKALIPMMKGATFLREEDKQILIKMGYSPEAIYYAIDMTTFERLYKISTDELLARGMDDLNTMMIFHSRVDGAEGNVLNDHDYVDFPWFSAEQRTDALDVLEMMNSVSEITEGMLPLTKRQTINNYFVCQQYTDAKPGEYLLYKTKADVLEIVDRFKSDFRPELLYLDMNVLMNCDPFDICDDIDSAREIAEIYDEDSIEQPLTYEVAMTINNKYRRKLERKRSVTFEDDNNIQLNEMLLDSKSQSLDEPVVLNKK